MNNVLMTAIVPHPPIIIPEVGGNELKKAEKTVNSLMDLSAQITGLNPDTVVVITPHSVFNPYYFNVYSAEKLHGNFGRFRAPQVALDFDNDLEFIQELGGTNPLPAQVPLDHGSLVPLYYLYKAGYKNKIVVINYTALGKEEHKNFGRKIAEATQKADRKIVLIASGDLSHKLLPSAPAGYDKNAHKFDDLVVESIKQGHYQPIEDVTMTMREIAGECAYNSLLVALGALGGKPQNNRVLSYEAPFGVGYVVAVM